MIENASSEELISALTNHLSETEEHVIRIEKIFTLIGKKKKQKVTEMRGPMTGLMKEAEEIMEECETGSMRDAGIISAAQKAEHYEIATYGTLRQFAETLGLTEVMTLLETTLDEEKEADLKLTEVAVSAINLEAAETEEEG